MTPICNMLSATSTVGERAKTLANVTTAGDDASQKAVAAEFEALFMSLLLKLPFR